jgi:hypothetical protein
MDSTHNCQDHQKPGSFEEGRYVIVYDGGVPVNSDVSRHSAQIGTLARGTRVEVLQIADQVEDGRVRGFIESPAGWISLGYGEACCFATLVERAVDRGLSKEAVEPQDEKEARDINAQEILRFFQVAASLAKIQAAASAGAQVQVAAAAGPQVCEHRRDTAREHYFDTLQMTGGWVTPRTETSSLGCSAAGVGAPDAAARCGRGGACCDSEGAETAEAERRAARLAKATELRQALDALRARDAANRRRRSEEVQPTGARGQKAAAGTERPGEGTPGTPGACRAEAAVVPLEESVGANNFEDPVLNDAKRKLASTIQALREVVLHPRAKDVAAA